MAVKLLALLMVLFPVFANAGMLGADFNFGDGTKPSYGVDYEAVAGVAYVDSAFSANRNMWQFYNSGGIQLEHLNYGLAIASTLTSYYNGGFHNQITIGPEVGFMFDLSKSVYFKENNSYMGFNDRYYLNSTISIGLNL
jgi:hypothetical protein